MDLLFNLSLGIATISITGIAVKYLSIKLSMIVLFTFMTISNYLYISNSTKPTQILAESNNTPQTNARGNTDTMFSKDVESMLNNLIIQSGVPIDFDLQSLNIDDFDKKDLEAFKKEIKLVEIQKELLTFSKELSENGIENIDFCNKNTFKITHKIINEFEKQMIKNKMTVPKNNCT